MTLNLKNRWVLLYNREIRFMMLKDSIYFLLFYSIQLNLTSAQWFFDLTTLLQPQGFAKPRVIRNDPQRFWFNSLWGRAGWSVVVWTLMVIFKNRSPQRLKKRRKLFRRLPGPHSWPPMLTAREGGCRSRRWSGSPHHGEPVSKWGSTPGQLRGSGLLLYQGNSRKNCWWPGGKCEAGFEMAEL